MLISELVEMLDVIAPPALADEGDPIGLQVGDPSGEARRVCVAVDASGPVIDLALARGADVLVAHHPLIYTPLRSLSAGDPVVEQALKLVRAGAALFVLHTNYDTVPGGINDALAAKLGVIDTTPLTNRKQDRLYKVVVFVPSEAVEGVRDAMAAAGAGVIGQYTHCSFRAPGFGSFTPHAGANPYVGSAGRLEEVEEFRLEMVCAHSRLDRVVSGMRAAHPYEEVAYDLYELANEPLRFGYGRVGSLERDTTVAEFAQKVREALALEHVKTTGDPNRMVRTIAVLGGGGSSLYREAAHAGAEVFVTGDVKHHDALNANALGVAVIDAGHFETERPGMQALAERLTTSLAALGVEVEYVE